MEHLQKGAQRKQNGAPTADIMVIMKTETGRSPGGFFVAPLVPIPSSPSLSLGVRAVSHTGPSASWLLSARHLFQLLALCREWGGWGGQLPIKTPTSPAPTAACQASDQRVQLSNGSASQANITVSMRTRMGKGGGK